ncbi:MAG: metallophosphoesterase family protein [Tissierellia bacterium]|nr:metallophosphoesterase family protein [Tissierellia bacterium]
MRFLYFTDTHIRGTNPKSRLDNFFESMMEKLREIGDLVEEHEVDYILHGGDLFDRPDISISVVSAVAQILQSYDRPIYTISGNHDIFGHNPVTLHRTVLGLLNALGVVQLVQDEPLLLEKEGTRVQLSGAPYIYGIDRPEHRELYRIEKRFPCDYAIHLVHGFLSDAAINPQIPHTVTSDILDTQADLTLSGHVHGGFKLQEIEGKKFLNPGALARISNATFELRRIPQVVLIDIVAGRKPKDLIRQIPLKRVGPGNEVLDRREIENHKFKRREIAAFKETIEHASQFDSVHLPELISDMAHATGVREEVRREAMDRVARTEAKGGLKE